MMRDGAGFAKEAYRVVLTQHSHTSILTRLTVNKVPTQADRGRELGFNVFLNEHSYPYRFTVSHVIVKIIFKL